jgi:hypothetical protein
MDAPSLRGLLSPRFLSRNNFSCFIFPESDDSIQDVPTPIARPIEILPPFSPICTASATLSYVFRVLVEDDSHPK